MFFYLCGFIKCTKKLQINLVFLSWWLYVFVELIRGIKHISGDRKDSLSCSEVTDLSHESLHLLWVDCVGPVAALLEVRPNDHSTCIKVALHVVVGHSGAYKHWDSHRLGNSCKSKRTTEQQQLKQFLKTFCSWRNINSFKRGLSCAYHSPPLVRGEVLKS